MDAGICFGDLECPPEQQQMNTSPMQLQNEDATDLEAFNRTTDHSVLWTAPMGAGLFLLSFLTFVGNAMVMHAFRTEARLQTVSNMFIMSLAAADLIVGLLVMPLGSLYAIKGDWVLGLTVCRLWLIIDYIASTASILNLCILSLDRYWSITTPLKYLRRRTKRRALGMISTVWCVSSCWILPVLFWGAEVAEQRLNTAPGQPAVCETGFADNWIFKLITATFNFYIPWLWMMFLYIRMFSVIKQRSKLEIGRFNQVQRKASCPAESINDIRQASGCGAEERLAMEAARNKQSLRRCSSADNYDNLILVSLPRGARGGEAAVRYSSRHDGDQVQVEMANEHAEYQETCLQSVPAAVETDAGTTAKRNHKGGCIEDESPIVQAGPSTMAQTGSRLAPPRTLQRTSTKSQKRRQHGSNNIILQREKKAAVQLSVIMGAFVLCWLPYSLLFVAVAVCGDCVNKQMYTASVWLGYLNSTLNPILYPLCNANFKQAFKNMLTRKNNSDRAKSSQANSRAAVTHRLA